MNEKKGTGNDSEIPILDGIPLRSSSDEFDPAEMLKCASCGRNTPPNRLDCIYCGTRLVLDDDQKALLKPVIRPPAEDADGFNLIYFPGGEIPSEEQIGLIGKMIRMEVGDIKLLTGSGAAVPVARGDSGEVAELAAERLRETGLDIGVFSDSVLAVESRPVRLRGISVEDNGGLALIHFNNDEIVTLSAEDVELIVVGLSLENVIEAKEKHKRKGLEKVLSATELSSDEFLIEIYARSHRQAFRIQATGFDFSFLGARKGLVASMNLKLTIQFFRDFAPNASFDESYLTIRSAIDRVWQIAESQDTKSVKRKAFGNFEKTRVTKSSNLEQFAKYSGLQRMALHRSKIEVV